MQCYKNKCVIFDVHLFDIATICILCVILAQMCSFDTFCVKTQLGVLSVSNKWTLAGEWEPRGQGGTAPPNILPGEALNCPCNFESWNLLIKVVNDEFTHTTHAQRNM